MGKEIFRGGGGSFFEEATLGELQEALRPGDRAEFPLYLRRKEAKGKPELLEGFDIAINRSDNRGRP